MRYQRQPARFQAFIIRGKEILQQCREIQLLFLGTQLALVHPRHHQQLAEHAAHAAHLGTDICAPAALSPVKLQRIQIGQDDGHWRFHFVTGIGNKLLLPFHVTAIGTRHLGCHRLENAKKQYPAYRPHRQSATQHIIQALKRNGVIQQDHAC